MKTLLDGINRIGMTAIIVLLAIILWEHACPVKGEEALPLVSINTKPYTHNMAWFAACPGPQCVFAGNFVVHVQQWGVYAVDVTRASWVVSGGMVSPVVGPGPGYQPAAWVKCNGDAHQSTQYVVASQKWVVATIGNIGNIGGCSPAGRFPGTVQVYRLGPGGLSYHGQFGGLQIAGSDHRIRGDVAYLEQGNGFWRIVDLDTLTVGGDINPPPLMPKQETIQGYTYRIMASNQQQATLVRSDQQGPTETPTVPQTVTQVTQVSTPTRTPTKCNGVIHDQFGNCYTCEGVQIQCPTTRTITRTPSRTQTVGPPTVTRTSTPVPFTPVPGRTVVPVTAVRTPQVITMRPTAPSPTASSTPTPSPRPSTTPSTTPINSWLPVGCRSK